MLEWSPTLIVAASEYEKVISFGLKVDIVFGNDENMVLQENTKWMFAPMESLPTVVKYLIAEKYPAVNIISTENKFDDLAGFLNQINIVLFTDNEKSYAVKKDFSVWKPAGTIFKIDIVAYFETDNLKQEENGDFVVIKDGFVSFDFMVDYLFLTEPLH